jgi:hypothetical protein
MAVLGPARLGRALLPPTHVTALHHDIVLVDLAVDLDCTEPEVPEPGAHLDLSG